MAQRPQPSLRFADGGSFITRWAQNVMRPNNTANRLRQVEAPPPAPAPAPPPPPPNPNATPDNPAGIRFQDGGVVPGTGRGDKIPAKYEPGEFVVSNDMIDDNPGLREQLSGLRAETLAARGKTVEEADAKALTGGRRPSLRADDGFGPIDRMARDLTGQNSLPPKSPVGNMADDLTRNARVAPPAPPAGPANPGMANPQAQAAYDDMARAKAQPTAPTVEPAAPKPPGAGSKWFGSADDWKNFAKGPADSPHKTLRMTAPEAPRGFGKGLLALQGAMGAKDAYEGFQEGDAWKAGVGTADAVAGAALFTPAAPIAGAYLGLRGAYDTAKMAGGAIYDHVLSDKAKDVVGGTFNQIGLNTGLWGEDDSAKLMADAQARLAKPADTPRTTAPGAAPDPRNPYADANAAKIAASDAQNKAAAAQDKAAPAAPPGYTNGVTRNGNEYSGTNVRGDITVNGFKPGEGLNLGSGPNAQNMAAGDALAGRDTLRSQGAALGGQPAGGSGIPAMAPTLHSGNSWEARNNLRNLEVSASSIYNSRSHWGNKAKGAADVAAFQNAQAMDTAARTGSDPGSVSRTNAQASMFGSKVAADASRYGSDNSLRGTMYTADAQLGAKQLEMQQRLRQQQALGELWKASGGKPEVFQQLAMQYGMTDAAKMGGEMVAARQTQAKANSEDAQSTFSGMFLDKDSKPDLNAEVMAHHLASQIVPGWENMSQEQRNANRTKVVEYTNMLQQANKNRDTSWLQKFGLAPSSTARSQIPDMNGAVVDEVGWIEGALKPNIGRGDKKVTLRDGSQMYFDSLNEAQQRLLEINGARRQQ